MTSPLTTQLHDTYAILIQQWTSTSIWTKAASILAFPLGYYFYLDIKSRYHYWLSLGPGGLPNDFRGYMIQGFLHYVSTLDTKSVECYDRPERYVKGWKQASESRRAGLMKSYFKEPVPRRRGRKGRAMDFVAPQREFKAGEWRAPHVVDGYRAAWADLCERNSEHIEVRVSGLERRGNALFLKSSLSAPLGATRNGEIAHIHESDYSAHVSLSFADAKEVIANGHGERHRLSGVGPLSYGYIMLYVPRTADEVELMKRIMQAGVDFMRSSQPQE
ncbi:hypothetical protein BAUCODRAFT_489853 [Baudoinia panamericana UAMH 10762]|uniref:Luciferase domain-containing protein n=1 Tax=Baudoinia panamericana (strain UAMH 10762) TaxID=717646 RepID=M2MYU2_BAUPA|nr:uncharacterized protein BAUCODRAFT_489853 [Baudoinia panamericana UAMH 10762]EMC96783.1 hypothetical protein BAUCODRAFT_489853 [Baudoinia panamericana UAMH 10762]